MAAKKNFSKVADNVLDQVMPQTQEVDEEQLIYEAQEEGRTQGRKGMKLPRINMAFNVRNADYIRVMARISGKTMTQFVNSVMDAERERNGEVYRKAKALLDEHQ